MALRPLAPDEAEDAGGLLARAFFDDPGAVMVEPDGSRRSVVNARLFAIDLRLAIQHVWAAVDDEGLSGIAVWIPPGASDEGFDQALVRAAVAVVGDAATQRWLALLDGLERLRQQVMPGPHSFLALLGVDPRAQHRGVGTALMQVGHDAADAMGVPCFLETLTTQNVAYYERCGYHVRLSMQIANDVRIHAMVRPARSVQ